MSVLPESLLALIRHGENYQIEYKEAGTEIPKSLYDTVSSFSNREGGDIFLGVHDCGVILGVDPGAISAMRSSFVTTINNPDKINPTLFLTVEEYIYDSDGSFVGTTKSGKKMQEKAGTYHILHIHIPISPSVIRNAGKIFDRNDDADVNITNNSDLVFLCYARKQSSYYVNKVFPNWKVSDLRADLIDKARQMAVTRKQLYEKTRHEWADMDDEALLRSSQLILTDEQGRTGITLAAVLLFGTDSLIISACAHHKTDCIYRVYNTDRYDDRDVIITNLIDSYGRMFDFGQRHLNDLFVLDGILNVSARDKILREIISNSLAHRDYSIGYIPKMIIEKDRITVENANRAHGYGPLDYKSFQPFAKNPTISKVFREIGYADELGSGMRNCYKYTRLYSGAEPEFIEGDIFKIIIPLSTGAMTKVGPSSVVSGTEASTEADTEASTEVKLDAKRLSDLLIFCNEPRTRQEMQECCGIKTEKYFREKVLQPMLKHGMIKRTIPDKPKSPKQKYVSAT